MWTVGLLSVRPKRTRRSRAAGVRNGFLGGDIARLWAADVRADFAKPDSTTIASEFVGTSITSWGGAYDRMSKLLQDPANGHIKYFDDRVRGHARAEITKAGWSVDFRQIDDAWKREPAASTLRKFAVQAGRAGVVPA